MKIIDIVKIENFLVNLFLYNSMSIIIQRKSKPLPDLKIKFWIFLKYMDDVYSQMFPANHPGDYNSPLSGNRALRWAKRVERKDMWQALFMSALFTPVGFATISEDSHNILGWLTFLAGLSAMIFLFMKTIENVEHTEKIEKDHEKRISNIEKEYQKRITDLEQKIAEL